MSKNIEAKKGVVADIRQKFEKAQSAVLVDYRGLNVAEDTELRNLLRKAGVEYAVLKNTMINLAVKDMGIDEIKTHLEGPTAVAFGMEDAVAPAKVLSDFMKKTKKMSVKCGVVDGTYIDEKGVEALDRLMEGEATSYMLASVHGACAPISNDLVTLLTKTPEDAEKRTFDVRDLENALYYSLLGVESYGFYGCAYGAVYAYEGEFYYIHYMDLGNQCFDADGNFSYRRGTVEGVKLEGDLVAELHTVGQDMNFYPLEYIDAGEEKNFDDTADYFDSARSAFIVGMVVFGFMIPTPLLIVGLVFPRSAKRGYPKYWYILAGVAALWMALSVLLMILVL